MADNGLVYGSIGASIRRVRLEAKLTQEELGKKVGLSRASINNIEHGRQKVFVHTFLELAWACGAPPVELLQGVPTEQPDVARWLQRIQEPQGEAQP